MTRHSERCAIKFTGNARLADVAVDAGQKSGSVKLRLMRRPEPFVEAYLRPEFAPDVVGQRSQAAPVVFRCPGLRPPGSAGYR
jgi:hypothetical protein